MTKRENAHSVRQKIKGLRVVHGILQDIKGKPGFEINLPKSIFPADWVEKDGDLVDQRLEFINTSNT